MMRNLSDTGLRYFISAYYESYQVLPPKGPVTIHQKALFILWLCFSCLWLFTRLNKKRRIPCKSFCNKVMDIIFLLMF